MDNDQQCVIRRLGLVRQLGLLVALVDAVELMIGTRLGARIGETAWLLALVPLLVGGHRHLLALRAAPVGRLGAREPANLPYPFSKTAKTNSNIYRRSVFVLFGFTAAFVGTTRCVRQKRLQAPWGTTYCLWKIIGA